MHSSCVVCPWLDLWVFHYKCIKCYLNQECQLGTFPVLVTYDVTLRPRSASIELQSVLPWPQALREIVVCASPEKQEVRACCLYDHGVEVSPRRTKANAADMLRGGLGSISSAPLKPQQRLYIATHHLLPKCHHQLPLPSSLPKYLRWLDRTVQPALRSWLKLPKDTLSLSSTLLWLRVDCGSFSMSTLFRSCWPSACQDRMNRRILWLHSISQRPPGHADAPD